MNRNTVTIKDIAAALNVSPTTIHKVIHGKKGVSEKTRCAVLQYLEGKNFRLNRAAAALKRRSIHLACVLIEPAGRSRFFFQDILAGVQNAINELTAFNVAVSIHFTPLSPAPQLEILEKLWREERHSLSGLVIIPAHEQKLNNAIRRFTEANIPVVTMNSDTADGSRQANVSGDNIMAGRVAGELMCSFLGERSAGKILLLGGIRHLRNNQEAAWGFFSIMEELNPELEIFECYEFDSVSRLEKQIRTCLKAFKDICGIYCNNVRGTITLCEIVRHFGLSGKFKVIGSDVHAELLPYFEDGTLNATTYQNPREQAHKSLWNLYYLVTGEKKVPEITKTRIGIVIKSNVKSYLST